MAEETHCSWLGHSISGVAARNCNYLNLENYTCAHDGLSCVARRGLEKFDESLSKSKRILSRAGAYLLEIIEKRDQREYERLLTPGFRKKLSDSDLVYLKNMAEEEMARRKSSAAQKVEDIKELPSRNRGTYQQQAELGEELADRD